MTPFDFARTLLLSKRTTKAEMMVAYTAIIGASKEDYPNRDAEISDTNHAIMARWSNRGLHDIKVGAWKIAKRKRDYAAEARENGVVKCERCLKPESDEIHGPVSKCGDCGQSHGREAKAHHSFRAGKS